MGKIIDNYNMQQELGSGVYSTVYKAVHMKTRQTVAIKMIKADKFRKLPKLEEGTINQINVLRNLSFCKHIIKYHELLKTSKHFYFVYEYCNGGTLERIISTHGHLSEQQTILYFKQILEAFQILNKHHIMHRDLKPENILLHDGEVKLADFGFCKTLENPEEMAQTMLGSPIYMAPQVLRGQNYTLKADIWSLGVILFRCLFGYCPFESGNIAKLIMKIQQEDIQFPDDKNVSPSFVQLLRRMLVKDHTKRADWNQVFRFQLVSSQMMNKYKQERALIETNFPVLRMAVTEIDMADSTTYMSQSNYDSLPHCKTETIILKPKLRTSIYQNPQSIFKQNQQMSKRPERTSTTNLNQSFSNCYNRSKSPIRQQQSGNAKIEMHIRKHSKFVDLMELCIIVVGYKLQSGCALAYIVAEQMKKQWAVILEVAKKQCINDYQDTKAQQTYGIILEELDHISVILESLQAEITLYATEAISRNRKNILKQFIGSLRLQDLNQIVMASRLSDYIEESLLIRKDTYSKLSKDQLLRQLKQRLS